jgi:hypothetical protein
MNWRMRRGIVRERERWWGDGIVEVSWPRMIGILGSWEVVGREGEERREEEEVRLDVGGEGQAAASRAGICTRLPCQWRLTLDSGV